MRSKEQKEQIKKLRQGTAPALVGLIILVISFTFVRPTIFKIIKIVKENQDLQTKHMALKTKAANLRAIDEFQIEKRVKIIERVFSSEKPVLNLLFTIARLSKETQVKFGGIEMKPGRIASIKKPGAKEAEEAKPIKTELGSTLESFKLEFKIEGKFVNISEFINRLEKIAPLMSLEDMSLSFSPVLEVGEEEKKEEKIEEVYTKLTIRVFYQSLPETMGLIDMALPQFTSVQEGILAEISLFETFEFEPAGRSRTGKTNPFEF